MPRAKDLSSTAQPDLFRCDVCGKGLHSGDLHGDMIRIQARYEEVKREDYCD